MLPSFNSKKRHSVLIYISLSPPPPHTQRLGVFHVLTDELLMEVLTELPAHILASLAGASRVMRAFATSGELVIFYI